MERTHPGIGLPRMVRPSNLWAWLVDGWHIFARAPIRIFLLALLPILVEGVLQLLPLAGVVASKLLTPLAFAWALAMLNAKAVDDRFAPGTMAIACASKYRPLMALAVLFAAVFVFQLALTWAIGGAGQARALGLGQVAALDLTRMELALILASGTLPGVALMFVLPRVLFDGLGIAHALADNARAVRRHWKPVAVLCLLNATAIAALVWFPLLLLLFLPFSLCVGYSSYRDVYGKSGD